MAAGLGASMAQAVYSVNAVGYVNLNIGTGFTMIANPLIATNNTIGAVINPAPNGTQLYKWNQAAQSFDVATYLGFLGNWDQPNITLNPGEGAFIQPSSPFTLTFVGDVSQGNLSNGVPTLYSIRASQVPQAGTVSSLGLSPTPSEQLYKWNRANVPPSFDVYTYVFGSWFPSEPTIEVGESFFLNTGSPFVWTRTFSVN